MCDNEVACEMTVPTDVVSVPQSRRHLRQWLDMLGWPEPARDDILLAVGEAVTNAVEHSADTPESIGPDGGWSPSPPGSNSKAAVRGGCGCGCLTTAAGVNLVRTRPGRASGSRSCSG